MSEFEKEINYLLLTHNRMFTIEEKGKEEFLKIINKAKKEIYATFYSGTSLETRKVLHKWFGDSLPTDEEATTPSH